MGKQNKKPLLKMIAILAKDWSHSNECLDMECVQLPMSAWTIGFMTHESENFIEISQLHFYKDGMKRCLLTLTKESIIKIFELKTGKEFKVKKTIFPN